MIIRVLTMKQLLPKIFKVLGWIIVGVLLLFLGIMQVFYTEWFQDELREKLVARVNASEEVKFSLEKLNIDFPLEITLDGLALIEPQNDTLIAANHFTADVSLLPLLKGTIAVEEASLIEGRYRIGDTDSAMCMNIAISQLSLEDAKLRLATNEILLSTADLNGGKVDLIIKNDSTPTPTDTTESVPWRIMGDKLHLTDFTYHMALESTIDSLNTYFGDAYVADLMVDIGKQTVDVATVCGERLDAVYVASIDETIEEMDSTETAPWIIKVDSIDFIKSKALYTYAGVEPSPGLDLNYLQVDSLDLKIKSFYNESSTVSIPITWMKGVERCGVEIEGSGTFQLDEKHMFLRNLDVKTPSSQLNFDARVYGPLDHPLTEIVAQGNGMLGVDDIAKMFPLYVPIEKGMSIHDKIELNVDVVGSMTSLNVKELMVDVAGRANLNATGHMSFMPNIDHMAGSLDLSGKIVDADYVNALISDDADEAFVLPVMTLNGNIDFMPQNINGNIKARTQGGDLALVAKWNGRTEGYDVDMKMNDFPIDAFLPRMGVGNVSGTVNAVGSHFNPFGKEMDTDAHVLINEIDYKGANYKNITIDALLKNNNAEVGITSDNKDADFDLTACCTFDKSILKWDINADVRDVNFKKLGIIDGRGDLVSIFSSKGTLDVENRKVRGVLQIDAVDWRSDSLRLAVNDINTKLYATDSMINLAMRNKDMFAFLTTREPLDTIISKLSTLGDVVGNQIDARRVDVEEIQHSLPQFNLNVRAGSQNLLSEYLAASDQRFERLSLIASNDSMISISGKVLSYSMGTTAIDTINFEAHQYDKILMYDASIGNRPGTLDEFARVTIDGYVADDLVSTHVQQHNIKGEAGYNIGALAQMGDSIVRFELFPETPMIAYKEWDINDENFIEYNMFTHHVDADVEMKNSSSSVYIYTEHNDSLHGQQEDLILKIKDLKLAELVAINPYAPPIKGDLSADMRVNWGNDQLNGKGLLSLNEFMVGKERVGSFDADLGIATNKVGKINANASLMVDGKKAMSLMGCLNDSTSASPVMLDLSVIHFPLKVLNPMIPKRVATLNGILNGEMKVSGDKTAPIINGNLNFDSTAVAIAMAGTQLNFSNVDIPVVDNVVFFNDFAITGVNKNPLLVEGTVDIKNLTSPKIDLKLEARDMQILGSNKSKRTDLYGKGFIDVDADIKGNLSRLDVDAKLNLLGGSNVTYIIPNATSAITSYNTEGMVKFVDFSDTIKVANEEQTVEAIALNLDVMLAVSEGSTINVDLSADGKNRVQLQGSGALNYQLDAMGDSRLTGRYTINKGFVRYTPPLMTEKLFDFVDGSYVAFNGDMTNPILNISAVDKVKANVTQEGRDSRLVNFDVELSVTNSLNDMNIEFDLSTPDDITIANELSTMSHEQRANQAINMLLYNVYTGIGSKGNTNLAGNPLYAFVESRLNSWAASNIGFVDVSFGIDQYDKTTGGTTSKATSYSYKVSKTLFNDRFKIVVGGNYSTDADADENYSQNLINDISFEYMLNRSGSMYIKLFRQVGYESILEGEVTQTGVGFVYKRKLKSLGDLFKKSSK